MKILREAGVKFATLGKAGGLQRRLGAARMGNEYLYQTMAKTNVEKWNGLGREGGHHPVPALLQHHQERVPGVRRQLPRHQPHASSSTS